LNHAYYYLAFVALAGVVISIYYYFGVVKAIYWSPSDNKVPVPISWPARLAIFVCIVGMLWLGLVPGGLLNLARDGAGILGY
jgi:NADH-quinone oxidoreductase subunit N